MVLVNEKTEQLICEGDIVETFRGEKVLVLGWTKPGNSGFSTGRVWVRFENGDECAYYPSVINAKLKN